METPGFRYCLNHMGINPDNFTSASVLAALSHVKVGVQVHAQLIRVAMGMGYVWQILWLIFT